MRGSNPREELPHELIEEYTNAFQLFVDGDVDEEKINLESLGRIMRGLDQFPTEAELKDMIREVDIDGDNEIDLEEFLQLMSSKTIDRDEEYREAFNLFDKGKTGSIAVNDLMRVFKKIGCDVTIEVLEQMVKEVSRDGVSIKYREFCKLMDKNISNPDNFKKID